MKSWFKLTLTVFALAAAGAMVAGVGPVMTEARWSGYTNSASTFLKAAAAGDTAALRGLDVDPTLVAQMVELRRRRPRLLVDAARSLETLNGMEVGDTTLIAYGIDHDGCDDPGAENRLYLSFLERRFERRVIRVRLNLCR